MALTLNGNRTGRAAVIERREFAQMVQEECWERIRSIEQAKLDFGDALADLKAADPDGWESWYDDDANVPQLIRWSDRAHVDEVIRRMSERAREIAARHGCACFEKAGDNDCPVHTAIVAQTEAV